MAYHESVQLGHDLVKKANSNPDDDADSDAGHALNDSDEEGNSNSNNRIINQLQDIVDGTNDNNNSELEPNSKFKKLFDMDFMKNAKARQKDKAREEASAILREIQDMEQSDDDSNLSLGDGAGRKDIDEPSSHLVDSQRKAQAKRQMEAMFFSRSKPAPKNETVSKPQASDTDSATNPWLSGIYQIDRALDRKLPGSKRRNADKKGTIINISAPVYAQDSRSADSAVDQEGAKKNESSTKTIVVTTNGKKKRIVVKDPSKSENRTKTNNEDGMTPNVDMNEPKKQILLQKSQSDLVKEAFAGPDYEAEFQTEKISAVDDELGIDTKKQKIMNSG